MTNSLYIQGMSGAVPQEIPQRGALELRPPRMSKKFYEDGPTTG